MYFPFLVVMKNRKKLFRNTRDIFRKVLFKDDILFVKWLKKKVRHSSIKFKKHYSLSLYDKK